MEWPLTGVAVLFLAAYAWPILQPSLGGTGRVRCEVVAWLAWGMFVVDYVLRSVQSRDRPTFLRQNVLDLLVIVLPLLRPLRLLRLVAMLKVLNRSAALALRGLVVVYFVGATVLIVFCAALAVPEAERPVDGAGIKTFPDALWWAVTTITTVGYGDVRVEQAEKTSQTVTRAQIAELSREIAELRAALGERKDV